MERFIGVGRCGTAEFGEVECREELCEAAADAMAGADPDLDPVWGLLVDAAGLEDAAPDAHTSLAVLEDAPDGTLEAAHPVETVLAEPPVLRVTPDEPPPLSKPISNVVDKAEVHPDRFPLPIDVGPPPVTRRDIDGCDAFVLDGVLTLEECGALIEQADGLWSFWDDSQCPRVAFRNAHTIEVAHQELADRVWHRVGQLVTPSLSFSEEDERFEVDIEGTWVPYAMNQKLLLSRYLDGGHFSPHTDGTTVVDFNRRTFYSCVLFLNDSPWGGHTRIYSDAQMGKELVKDSEGRLTGDPELILDAIPPAPGRMLVFYHRLMHEGVPAAEKYIIRTDVLYHREPEQCTAPEDAEAFQMYEKAQLLAEHGDCQAAAELFRRAFKHSPALRQVYRS